MPRKAPLYLLAAVLTCACKPTAPSGTPDTVDAASLPVKLLAARSRTVDRAIDVLGTLYAEKEATVAAEVDGRVREILVDLGDRVEVSQVLARLDTDMLAASLRQAEVRFDSARADEERARRLHDDGIVAVQEYERLRTARDAARAERDLLALRVEHATIRAPIAGAVTGRRIDVGDYARTGSPLYTIVADRTLRLRGEVSERYVPDLALGLDLRGEVEAYPGLTVRGRLTRLNAALDPKTRSLTVEAEVNNADGRLRPGFFVRGAILTQQGVPAVSIPSAAVITFAGVSHVFVFADGQAHEREIQTGQRFDDEVEVLSGVAAGEPIIVSGLSRLREGTRVKVATETAEAPAG